jgi:DUF4097 and DUF4098 domain-containing protein YvlB
MRASIGGFISVGVVMLVTLGCQSLAFKATRTTQHTAPAPTAELVVDARNGAIIVQGTDGADLVVTANQTAQGMTQEAADELLEQIQIRLEEKGEEVHVYAETPKVFNGGVGFEIQVPRGVRLRANSGNGAIEVRGLAGEVIAKTSNGRIIVEGATAAQNLQTSNGAIELTTDGPVAAELDTSNGSIQFKGQLVGTGNRFKTSNGAVKCVFTGGKHEVRAATSNGGITFNGEKVKKGETINVGEGDSEPAVLDLKTSNGTIKIESGVAGEMTSAGDSK